MRIRQEILLGIGGLRALHAAGVEPSICHMNEGHSAFLALERIARAMADHDLDYGSKQQINIYNGRGWLVEAEQGPVWMYGTSSEHSILYQYKLI